MEPLCGPTAPYKLKSLQYTITLSALQTLTQYIQFCIKHPFRSPCVLCFSLDPAPDAYLLADD